MKRFLAHDISYVDIIPDRIQFRVTHDLVPYCIKTSCTAASPRNKQNRKIGRYCIRYSCGDFKYCINIKYRLLYRVSILLTAIQVVCKIVSAWSLPIHTNRNLKQFWRILSSLRLVIASSGAVWNARTHLFFTWALCPIGTMHDSTL